MTSTASRSVGLSGVAVVVILLAQFLVGFGARSADAQTGVRPVPVETVPPVAGVQVELDGQVGVTGADGKVTLQSDELRSLITRIKVRNNEILSPDGSTRYRYNRIYGQGLPMKLTFDVEKRVGFSFATIKGTSIKAGEIDRMEIKSSVGEVIEDVPLTEPVWLKAQRVVSARQGPELRDILWSVTSVIVGESTVVNRSQFRFEPARVSAVAVELLYFQATFRVRDTLFGGPTGSRVRLTSPDGTVTTYDLDDQGEVTIPELPRGEYEVAPTGSGLQMDRPLALSRDQDMELKMVTNFDLALVALAFGLFVIVPLIVGLVRWRRRSRRERRPHGGGGRGSPAENESAEADHRTRLSPSSERVLAS